MPPADKPKIDRLTRTLLGAYERAGKMLDDELKAIAEDDNQLRRRARLKELQAEVERLKEQLDAQVQSWTQTELRTVYELGATVSSKIAEVGFSWTQTHEAALRVVARSTNRNMLKATTHMTDDVKRLVRASSKETTLMKLLTGQTAVQAGRELRGELTKNKVSAIIYKNGARHSIAEYSAMVLRTNTAIAYNKGTLLESKQHGMKYAIAYDGPGCCLGPGHDSGPSANNLIIAIGQAMQNLIAHPNCRRSWQPLPDIKSNKQAEEVMKEGTYATTASQDKAQKAADAVRIGKQRNAARKRARDRRIAARAAKVKSA